MGRLVRLPSMLAVLAIVAYQRTLGRLVGNRCRFHPTCSQYARESIESNGLIRGGIAAVWRLLRCGPWTAGGIDHPKIRVHEGAVGG